jgi:hypothetical protein
MEDDDLAVRLLHIARRRLQSELDAEAELPDGVRLVDSWENRRYAATLFWIDRTLNFHGWDTTVLHDVLFRRDGNRWRAAAAGGSSPGSAEQIAATKGPDLRRVGGTSQDPVRLTRAFASPEVYTIELRSAHARTSRRPGLDGFCLLGITHSDPITYARALDHDGHAIAGEPLLL